MNFKKYIEIQESSSREECKVCLEDCIAKTEKKNDGTTHKGMTVEEHCKLTGYVSRELVNCLYSNTKLKRPLEGYDLIAALHDIGKVSKPFQEKIYDNLSDKEIKPSFIKSHNSSLDRIKHASVGKCFLDNYCSEREKENIWKSIARIVSAHHGGFSDYPGLSKDTILGGLPYHNARIDLFDKLSKEFVRDTIYEEIDNNELDFLTGLTVVSDWISSSRMKSELESSKFEELAKEAVLDAGYSPLSIKKCLSFKDIFGFSPYPIQKDFIDSVTSPGTYILEVEMGMGKTEAALFASYKLLEKGLANGIYFALPTKLTSISIYQRMGRFLDKITNKESKAKLIFNDSYNYLHAFDDSCECSPGNDWFDNTKRSILAPFGVGTVDQALMSVINVKHSALRTFGLSGKVLIIDELHSYDDYTGTLITDLVKQVRDLGGTVIILSATLSFASKEKVLEWKPEKKQYPLITVSNEEKKAELSVEAYTNKRIKIIHCDKKECAIDSAIEHAQNGEKVLWIDNTVDEAQDVYTIISSRVKDLGIDVGLLHSRFTQYDRKRIEDKWIPLFGKGTRCRKGTILIGTQVLEQSLDIDADFMVTNIAPIDMLFQRMGRLWRHRENDKDRNVKEPICLIMHPRLEDVLNDPEIFGNDGAIYSPYVLFRTLKNIEKIEYLCIPQSIREMIENTYKDEEPEDSRIKELLDNMNEKKREMESKAKHANNQAHVPVDDLNAKTRYNSIESSTLVLLRSYDPLKKTITLCDGSFFEIRDNITKEERVKIGSKALLSSMSVPTKKIPNEAFIDEDSRKLLSRFIYFGKENKTTGVLIVNENGELLDVFGNTFDQCDYKYDAIIGYRCKND